MNLGYRKMQQLLVLCCLLLLVILALAPQWLGQPVYASNQASAADFAPRQAGSTVCKTPLDQWARHLIDTDRPGRAVFVQFADLDNDGVEDVVTGGFWYRNLQNVSGPWTRHAVGSTYGDTLAVYDFDADGDLDLLGTRSDALAPLPFVWARNDGQGQFTIFNNIDSELSPPARAPIQGVTVARFQPNGPLQIAISWDKEYAGIQMLTVSADPTIDQWTRHQASPFTQGEELSTADLDGDGDLDLFTGTAWLRNEWPADQWTPIVIHTPTSGAPDRHRLVDMDHDGDLDAVVGYGHDPEAKVVWYEQPASPTSPWPQHLVANLTTPALAFPQNLDVADLDGDGDLDSVTAQHRQKEAVLQASVLENVDGAGLVWAQHAIYTGDEHHDGMQLLDIEGDGDLDIVSIGWTHGQVILYENTGNRSCPAASATPITVLTPSPTVTPIATATPSTTATSPLLLTPTPISSATPVDEPNRTINGQLFLPLVAR